MCHTFPAAWTGSTLQYQQEWWWCPILGSRVCSAGSIGQHALQQTQQGVIEHQMEQTQELAVWAELEWWAQQQKTYLLLPLNLKLPYPSHWLYWICDHASMPDSRSRRSRSGSRNRGWHSSSSLSFHVLLHNVTHMPAPGCKMEGSRMAIMTSGLSSTMSGTGPISISTTDDADVGHSATWGMVKDAISVSSIWNNTGRGVRE